MDIELRDYFAGQALQGMLARTELTWRNDIVAASRLAYEIADAMLKERDLCKPSQENNT